VLISLLIAFNCSYKLLIQDRYNYDKSSYITVFMDIFLLGMVLAISRLYKTIYPMLFIKRGKIMKTTLNKNIIAIAIGFSLVTAFSQSAIAQPPPGGGDRGGERGERSEPDAASILSRMDADGDGVVTLTDFLSRETERSERHFDRLDSDADGYVSEEEFTTSRGRRNNDDIDHDALKLCIEETTGITLNERPSREDAFAAADTDNDGYLSPEEFNSDRTAHVTEKFAELDSDSDGVISEDEVSAKIAERQVIDSARKDCVDEQLLLDDSTTDV